MSGVLSKVASGAAKVVSGAKDAKAGVKTKGKEAKSAFGRWLGVERVGRGPFKEQLTLLQSQVATYQPSVVAQGLAGQLETALTGLYKSGDEAARQASVIEAERVANEVKTELDRLAKAAKDDKPKAPDAGEKKVAKDAKKEREALLKRLKEVAAKVPADLGDYAMPTDPSQPNLSRMALLAATQWIERAIGGGAQPSQQDDLSGEIDELAAAVDAATSRRNAIDSFLKGPGAAALKGAETMLKAFGQAISEDGQPPVEYAGPLRDWVEKLRASLTAKPADQAVTQMWMSKIAVVGEAGLSAPDSIRSTHVAAVAEQNAGVLEKRLQEGLSGLWPDVSYLQDAGSPDRAAVSARIEALHAQAAKPVTDLPGAEKALDDGLAALADDLERYRGAVETGLGSRKTAVAAGLETVRGKVDALGKGELAGTSALAADRKTLQAQVAAIEAALKQDPLGPQDLALAEALQAEAAGLLQKIDGNAGALKTLDADLKALGGKLDERSLFGRLRGNAREMLEKYDPKTRAKLAGELTGIVDGMTTTPSAQTLADLQKLQDKAKTAVEGLQPAVDVLEKTAAPLLSEMKLEIWGWIERSEPVPKAYADALDALEKAVKARPPIEADLTAAQAAASGLKGMALDARKGKADQEKADDKKAEADNAKRRAEETAKLRPLKRKLSAVESAVQKVGGDKNELATIQRLMGLVERNIEDNAFDKLDSRRGDLQSRLDLLLANPKGEANRRRTDLPGALREFAGAISAAQAALASTQQAVQEYAPAGAPDAAGDVPSAQVAGAAPAAAALLEGFVRQMDGVAAKLSGCVKPVTAPEGADEDARRAAREAGLQIVRAFRDRIKAQPVTALLLQSPFAEARGAMAPLFTAVDKIEYSVITCI